MKHFFRRERLRIAHFATVLFFLTGVSCTSVFYYPMEEHVLSPKDIDLSFEDVQLHTSDGEVLHSWYLPARGPLRGTVLFLHGNAENISTHIGAVYWLPNEGFDVLLLDYRGYGKSSGTPHTRGALMDIEAALTYLVEERKKSNIILFGQSLGGALGVSAIAKSKYKKKVTVLLVDSTFASYRDIAREKLASIWLTWPLQYPLSWIISDDLSPNRYIAELGSVPKIFVHGTNDLIVPIHHGRALFKIAPEPKEFWEMDIAGHSSSLGSPQNRRRLTERIIELQALHSTGTEK